MMILVQAGTEVLFTTDDLRRVIELFVVNVLQRHDDLITAKKRAIADMTELIESKVELVQAGVVPLDWQSGQIIAHRDALAEVPQKP